MVSLSVSQSVSHKDEVHSNSVKNILLNRPPIPFGLLRACTFITNKRARARLH